MRQAVAPRRNWVSQTALSLSIEYYMLLNHWLLEPRLIKVLCEGAIDGLNWLEDLGVVWAPEKLYVGGLETAPRAHVPVVNSPVLGPGGGGVIADALYRAVRERGIPVARIPA